MSIGIISIILGVILIIGIIFYQKPKRGEKDQNPIHRTYQRGIEILSVILRWGIPFFLLGSGIYYLFALNKEAQEKKERLETELAQQIHFKQLLGVVNTPNNEREMKILELGFDPKGTNEFGKVYERDFGTDVIEAFETGTIRYLSKSKDSYLRVFKEAKEDNLQFKDETSNNRGDKFSNYVKSDLNASFGYFTSTQMFASIISDNSKVIVPGEFLPDDFMVGSWGRVSLMNSGKYTLNENRTFLFEDSHDGPITGKWHTEKKTVIFNYDKKTGQYGIAHSLSMNTEIINVTSKEQNNIEGYLDGNELRTITLSRQ